MNKSKHIAWVLSISGGLILLSLLAMLSHTWAITSVALEAIRERPELAKQIVTGRESAHLAELFLIAVGMGLGAAVFWFPRIRTEGTEYMTKPNGTDLIADRFADLGSGDVCFEAPADAAENWIPAGYELVTDPGHLLARRDCILPFLSTDWRLVSDVNAGARVGRRADDAGPGVHYVAKPITP